MKTAIIDYGAGNINSVRFALQRLGVESICTTDSEIISSAEKVIFPGVGEASNAMAALKKTGLEKLIPNLQQPILGICLGMQLMCEFSEENETTGLGIFPEKVKKFKGDLKIPHMGWNQIFDFESPLFEGIPESTHMYFVHSFFVEPSDFTACRADYGGQFSAALQHENFYGCQFHLEKSGAFGSRILENFLKIKS